MKKYKVIIEAPAEFDLREAIHYITETLKEPATARRIYRSIKDKILKLDQMPLRFPFVRDKVLASRGLHWMPVENYSVFYVVDEDERTVNVLRILYSRREWQVLLHDTNTDGNELDKNHR